MFGKVICRVMRKHKRGKLVDKVEVSPGKYVYTYRCPRCEVTHIRKKNY